jgi:hypothetical protein
MFLSLNYLSPLHNLICQEQLFRSLISHSSRCQCGKRQNSNMDVVVML